MTNIYLNKPTNPMKAAAYVSDPYVTLKWRDEQDILWLTLGE